MPIKVGNAQAWRALQRAFDLRGRHQLQLDEVIVPVVVLPDIFDSPDAAAPRDCTYNIVSPGAAAVLTTLLLENPAGSGWIILVDKVSHTTESGSISWIHTLTSVAPLAAIAGGAADKTWNDATIPTVPPGAMFADGAAAWAGDEIFQQRALNNTMIVHEPKVVLQPGQLYAVQAASVQVTANVTFNCRAVPLPEAP